jgi:DNA-binding NarL/FixJ family response regulator
VTQSRPPSGPARVVLVEDDASVRGVVEILLATDPELELVGWAESAEQGLELVCDLRPDLVVLDNQLTGVLSGVDAAPRFKQAVPGLVVLLCTALDLAAVAARTAEIDGFLRKDRLAELPEVARELLGR